MIKTIPITVRQYEIYTQTRNFVMKFDLDLNLNLNTFSILKLTSSLRPPIYVMVSRLLNNDEYLLEVLEHRTIVMPSNTPINQFRNMPEVKVNLTKYHDFIVPCIVTLIRAYHTNEGEYRGIAVDALNDTITIRTIEAL